MNWWCNKTFWNALAGDVIQRVVLNGWCSNIPLQTNRCVFDAKPLSFGENTEIPFKTYYQKYHINEPASSWILETFMPATSEYVIVFDNVSGRNMNWVLSFPWLLTFKVSMSNSPLCVSKVNNLIILTNETDTESETSKMLASFREKYRRLVNSQMLFVSVDLAGTVSRWGFLMVILAWGVCGLSHYNCAVCRSFRSLWACCCWRVCKLSIVC